MEAQPAVTRVKQAAAEIKKVARKEPVVAADFTAARKGWYRRKKDVDDDPKMSSVVGVVDLVALQRENAELRAVVDKLTTHSQR